MQHKMQHPEPLQGAPHVQTSVPNSPAMTAAPATRDTRSALLVAAQQAEAAAAELLAAEETAAAAAAAQVAKKAAKKQRQAAAKAAAGNKVPCSMLDVSLPSSPPTAGGSGVATVAACGEHASTAADLSQPRTPHRAPPPAPALAAAAAAAAQLDMVQPSVGLSRISTPTGASCAVGSPTAPALMPAGVSGQLPVASPPRTPSFLQLPCVASFLLSRSLSLEAHTPEAAASPDGRSAATAARGCAPGVASPPGMAATVEDSLGHTSSSSSGYGMHPHRTKRCVVCLDAHSCVLLRPCGHEVLCEGCWAAVAARAARVPECPYCRRVVHSALVLHPLAP
jgi:hypothetical protein